MSVSIDRRSSEHNMQLKQQMMSLTANGIIMSVMIMETSEYVRCYTFKATLCSSDVFVKQQPLEPLWCTCTVVNNVTPLLLQSTELLMMLIG